jgi:hypothetical protein
MVDGGTSPELISDATAYRLYLLTVSVPANSTEEDRSTQAAHLNKTGLKDKDLQSFLTILAEFRSEFEAWKDRFDGAARAQGPQFDPKPFLQQREDIVHATRIMIGKSLSAEGVSRLNSHIQAEKRFMKVAAN